MYQGLYDTSRGLAAADRRDVGDLTAVLMLEWPRWTFRRVDTITPTNAGAVRRSTSVDFALPVWFHVQRLPADFRAKPQDEQAQEMLSRRRRHLVPLAWFKKQLLVNFNLRDDDDRAIPLLTHEQNAQVAAAVLESIGRAVLGEDVPEPLFNEFRRLVACPADRAQYELDLLLRTSDENSEIRRRLRSSSTFVSFAEAFSHSFLALAMVHSECHERRVVRFEVEQRIESGRARRTGAQAARDVVGALLGDARPLKLVVTCGDAASSHVEVVMPPTMKIRSHALVVHDGEGVDAVDVRTEEVDGRLHLHLHSANTETLRPQLFLVPIPRSFALVRSAFLVGVLAVLAQVLVAYGLEWARKEADATTSVMLSFSALLTVFVARADGQGFSTEALWWSRVLAIGPGVGALCCAVFVIFASCAQTCAPPPESWIPWALSVGSALCVALLGVTWWRSSDSRKVTLCR